MEYSRCPITRYQCSHRPVKPQLLIALLLLTAETTGWAALGQLPSVAAGSETHTASPRANRLAATGRTQFVGYAVERSSQEDGTLVRELIGPDGVVFAVTWQGPVLPNLQALLGNHFGTFMAFSARTSKSRGIGSPLSVRSDALVIHSGGRMRGFRGYAYLPERVPAGINISDVL